MLTQDPAVFDTEFFGIKPVEARALDPQQRLLLETVYEGLEAAGIPMERLRGTDTGVYVGLMCNDYEAMLLRGMLPGETDCTYYSQPDRVESQDLPKESRELGRDYTPSICLTTYYCYPSREIADLNPSDRHPGHASLPHGRHAA